MRVQLAALGVAAGLWLWGGGPASAAEPTAPRCQIQQVAEMAVSFAHNQPMVEVSINGKPSRMLLDTGAQRSILYKAESVRMGLNPVGADATFEGVGGVRGALEVTIAKFGLGKSIANNLRLYVLDGGQGEGVVGILGQDLLSQADLEFDLAHGMVRMFSEQGCAHHNLAYWTSEPLTADLEPNSEFRLRLKLNGRIIHALLDSGSTVSAVTAQAAADAGGTQTALHSPDKMTGIGAKAVEVDTVTFETLAIGDEEIKRPKLLVGDYFKAARTDAATGTLLKTSSSDSTQVLLGADFLRAHRVLISHQQNLMFFTYTGGPVFQVVTPETTQGQAVTPDRTTTPGRP